MISAWNEGMVRAMASMEADFSKELPAKQNMADPKRAAKQNPGLARRLADWALKRSRNKGPPYNLLIRAGHTREVEPTKVSKIYNLEQS